MTNGEVAQAWMDGRAGHAMNFSTDGKILRSYALIIGDTRKDGTKVVGNFRRRGGGEFYSMTTSHHVAYALGRGAKLVDPQCIPR
jgi:hypothetical protein